MWAIGHLAILIVSEAASKYEWKPRTNFNRPGHLDAQMLARGLVELKPSFGSVVLIENVGNLV
jgi:Ni2+-binding GTPase involved in maturation of urease and hydrogenase